MHRSAPVLRHMRDFCAGFFHIEECVEAGMNEICLCHSLPCRRKTVTCLARLRRAGERDDEASLFRYDNRREADGIAHAEAIMCRDRALLDALAACEGGELTLFLTYQPCHYSGGHRQQSKISCTNTVIHFHEHELQPRRISLHIRIAYVYRAHWQKEHCAAKYWPMIHAARAGMLLLRDAGVEVSAFRACDWKFVLACSSEAVREALRATPLPILQRRSEFDTFMRAFLDELNAEQPAGPAPRCMECDSPCEASSTA